MHSCECLIYSFDLHEVATLQLIGEWEKLEEKMILAAQRLERGGADFIVLCTNTMHKAAHEIESNIQIPFLHIVDPTAELILGKSINKVGFLGTRFSMEQGFIRDRYHNVHQIETIIPDETDRIIIHDIIYNELIKGIVSLSSKQKYQTIIQKLIDRGAEGIIAGCTEIEILIKPQDISVPLFETSRLHAEKAVLWALA
ncbi:MAG: amino acid racemase [Saprospiraceae bacterium]|nr:amino acid racemase [Saprospiraceae bacterium]